MSINSWVVSSGKLLSMARPYRARFASAYGMKLGENNLHGRWSGTYRLGS